MAAEYQIVEGTPTQHNSYMGNAFNQKFGVPLFDFAAEKFILYVIVNEGLILDEYRLDGRLVATPFRIVLCNEWYLQSRIEFIHAQYKFLTSRRK